MNTFNPLLVLNESNVSTNKSLSNFVEKETNYIVSTLEEICKAKKKQTKAKKKRCKSMVESVGHIEEACKSKKKPAKAKKKSCKSMEENVADIEDLAINTSVFLNESKDVISMISINADSILKCISNSTKKCDTDLIYKGLNALNTRLCNIFEENNIIGLSSIKSTILENIDVKKAVKEYSDKINNCNGCVRSLYESLYSDLANITGSYMMSGVNEANFIEYCDELFDNYHCENQDYIDKAHHSIKTIKETFNTLCNEYTCDGLSFKNAFNKIHSDTVTEMAFSDILMNYHDIITEAFTIANEYIAVLCERATNIDTDIIMEEE